jgi:outer membrane protein W/outer membrane protein OmpA-like peptidoglycan-associated protein
VSWLAVPRVETYQGDRTIWTEEAYHLARVRQDRDALISVARRHVQAAGRADPAPAAALLGRMHRALAHHHVFGARNLNRRLVALKRGPAGVPEGEALKGDLAAQAHDGPVHAAESAGGLMRALRRSFFSPSVALLALLCSITAAPFAYAQADSSPVSFDIPAQPMAAALNAWAVQANLQVFFEQGPVQGLVAPPVSGSLLPTQALKQLLAKSRLEYTQNADGAFVVRPRALMAARVPRPLPAPAAAPLAAPVALPAPAAPVPRTAREAAGPWIVRLRGADLVPRSRSDALSFSGPAPQMVPADETRTNSTWAPEFDLEYFFNSHWSAELALDLPRAHELSLTGARVGTFRLMPDYLTAKYNFNPEGTFRPYLGAGLNLSSFYDQSVSPALALSRTTTGPAAQAGFDVQLSEHWLVNLDVKWARARPAVGFAGAPVGQLHLDPMLYGIGVGYRFGGSPAPAPAAAPPPAPAAQPDSDGDGVPDSADKCPNTPHGVAVDAAGCPLDSDHDGVPDYLDKCPGTPAGLKVDADGCEVEELVLRGVNFHTDSAQLTPDSFAVLDAVLAVLRGRRDDRAALRGYTDARGADDYNLKLSERRAAAVVDYLTAHGIARAALSATGLGKANPVATNDTEAGRAANRRVTVQFSRPVAR